MPAIARRPGDDVRLVWLLAALVLVSGYAFVHVPYRRAIAGAYSRTESLYRRTLVNDRIVRETISLRARQRRIASDLAHVLQGVSLSRTTAELLVILQASATRNRVQVLAVEPGADQGKPAAGDLLATPLEIRVRGTFPRILGFVEDLPHHAALLAVTNTQLSLAGASASGADPTLEATIDATLYRLHEPQAEENDGDDPAAR